MENTVSECKKVWFILLSDAQSDTLMLSLFYVAWPLFAPWTTLHEAAA